MSDLAANRMMLRRGGVSYTERRAGDRTVLDVEAQGEGGFVSVLSQRSSCGTRWTRQAVRARTLRFNADGSLASARLWRPTPTLPLSLTHEQLRLVVDALGVSLVTWTRELLDAVDALRQTLGESDNADKPRRGRG